MFRPNLKPVLISVITITLILPLLAGAQQNRKPLTEAEVIDLLKNEVPSPRVESLVRQYGIAFEMNDQAESALLVAGATDELLSALREISQKPAAPPTLLIEATPGGAQVFVDDELFAKTSSEGRLKISTLSPGPHRVRISLDGFRDYEQSVTLAPGQIAKASTILQAASAVENSRLGSGKGAATGAQPPGLPVKAQAQRLIIPQGTVITVHMIAGVDSSRDQVGKQFAAKVDTPIAVSGNEAIPLGTDAQVRLLSIGNNSQPSLQLQLFTLTVNGKVYNVASTVYSQTGAANQKPATQTSSSARLGGVLGALARGSKSSALGAAIGGAGRGTNNSGVQASPQTVAAETKLDFTLRAPIIVTQ